MVFNVLNYLVKSYGSGQKTLDIHELTNGIKSTLTEIEEVQERLSYLQALVGKIIASQDALSGQTGRAIRESFQFCHELFIDYMYVSLSYYHDCLQTIQNAFSQFEPDSKGLIKEEYLSNTLTTELKKTDRQTSRIIHDTNQEIKAIHDIINLSPLKKDELDKLEQSQYKDIRNVIQDLQSLDRAQAKSLKSVKKEINLLNDFKNEIGQIFAGPKKLPDATFQYWAQAPTYYKLSVNLYGEPEPIKTDEDEGNFFQQAGKVGTGVGKAVWDIGKDTVVGTYEMVRHPIDTLEGIGNAVLHPIDTYNQVEAAIKLSYEEDVTNGSLESQAHWYTYAAGSVLTSLNPKGAKKLSQAGTLGKKGNKLPPTPKGTALNNLNPSALSAYTSRLPSRKHLMSRFPYNTFNTSFLTKDIPHVDALSKFNIRPASQYVVKEVNTSNKLHFDVNKVKEVVTKNEMVQQVVGGIEGLNLKKQGSQGQSVKGKGNTSKLRKESNLKNIDDFINGNKKFEEVIEDYAKIYKEHIDSNKPWSWDDSILGGDSLSAAQKRKIKEKAIEKGHISKIKVTKVDGMRYGFADFLGAGVVEETVQLPERFWKLSDKEQFKWLDEQIGGTRKGMTWHHTEVPGKMELVPFGIHNITPHNGGRTKGMWADAPR